MNLHTGQTSPAEPDADQRRRQESRGRFRSHLSETPVPCEAPRSVSIAKLKFSAFECYFGSSSFMSGQIRVRPASAPGRTADAALRQRRARHLLAESGPSALERRTREADLC
jgi:hypothetical protein